MLLQKKNYKKVVHFGVKVAQNAENMCNLQLGMLLETFCHLKLVVFLCCSIKSVGYSINCSNNAEVNRYSNKMIP
jgi:hypothetical protein